MECFPDQGDGNQGWLTQYPGVNGNTSNFPPSNPFQGVHGGGVDPIEFTTHAGPGLSLSTHQPRQSDNAYQQMQGGVNDDLLFMSTPFRNNLFQSHDPTNTSFESIDRLLVVMENRERSSSRRTPHRRLVSGRAGRRMSSNHTLSSYTSGDGSGFSGAEGSTTTLSSFGMYGSNMGFGAATNALQPLPQTGQLNVRPYARSTTDTSSLASAEVSCTESECGRTFHGEYRHGNLARHQKQVHNNGATFKCAAAACSKVYRRKDARLKHYRIKHEDLAVDNPFVPRLPRIRPMNGERAQDLEGIFGDRE